jgi:hypothetical protein
VGVRPACAPALNVDVFVKTDMYDIGHTPCFVDE